MTVLRKFITATQTVILTALGILMIYSTLSGISKYFIAHTFSVYVFLTGILFLCWTGAKIWHTVIHGLHECTVKGGIRTLVLYILLICLTIPVFHYRETIMARKAASGQELTDAELEKLIRHYPGESSSQQGNPSENAEPVPDTLKADSGKILAGYYKNEKHIEINDAQLYPWMEEIEEHLNNYTGWTVTMKGQVVTDPSLFEPGTFSPTRELMTCCVADLSLIGFTCLYDIHGPYAELVKEDTWVTVTGIITAGTYQGEPEPQIQCTEIKEAVPPENPYLYP